MRSIKEVRLVLRLVQQGFNDCEISRRTGIPRGTVMGWRHGRVPRRARPGAPKTCAECGHPEHDFGALPARSFAYLLGIYLGDGCILRMHRKVYALKIFLDRRYPGIVDECATAMSAVMPSSRVSVYRRRDQNAEEVGSYSRAWPCLFPQHGPGMKHTRPIRLTDWQREIVEEHTKPFLRGLIHSDGCYSVNTIKHPKKTYVYPRYLFSNRSADIRGLFCEGCDKLGIEWRQMNAFNISVARRDSVAMMDEFVGPKE